MPGTVSGIGEAAVSLVGFVQPLTQGTDVPTGRADSMSNLEGMEEHEEGS